MARIMGAGGCRFSSPGGGSPVGDDAFSLPVHYTQYLPAPRYSNVESSFIGLGFYQLFQIVEISL